MNINHKRTLMDVARERGCFLDGEPAVIVGAFNDFATVATLDGSAQADWAWEAVSRAVDITGGEVNFRT